MLLNALHSSYSFIFARLLDCDQLNVCVCVRALHNVSFVVSRIRHHLKCCNLWSSAQTLPGSLHFQNAWRFCRCTRRCNLIDSRKESTAFPSSIFKKVAYFQCNNVQISCTEFFSNRAKSVGSTITNSSTPASQHGYWYGDFPQTYN